MSSLSQFITSIRVKRLAQNLIIGLKKYKNAGMVVPIVYDNYNYSKYDFYDLKYSKQKKRCVFV